MVNYFPYVRLFVDRYRGAKTPDFDFLPVRIWLTWSLSTAATTSSRWAAGAPGKGRSQFKGLTYDRKVILFHADDQRYTPGARVPLHCIGFA